MALGAKDSTRSASVRESHRRETTENSVDDHSGTVGLLANDSLQAVAEAVERPEEQILPSPRITRPRSNSVNSESNAPLSIGQRLGRWLSKEITRLTQGPRFGYTITALIGANIVLLAAEIDYPDTSVWWLCDIVFLLAFAAEIAFTVWMREDGAATPTDRCWVIFDCALVLAGVLEVLLLWLADFHSSVAILSLRLVRLLRLLKFFKFSKRLSALAVALLQMIEPFTLIFGVLFLFILTGAVFCTQLLGRMRDTDGGDNFTPEDVRILKDSFGDVYTATFTLFQITTLDNWMDAAGPVARKDWRWQLFFVVFISFGSWTMISILTAVASDSMVAAASDREETEAREREALRENFLNFLRDAFLEADADGNGVMDRTEFEDLIKKDSVITYMSGQGVGVTVDDLKKAWETLDASAGRTGELTIDEFVTGFLTLSKGISTHDIANVDYGLRKTTGQAAHRITRLTKLVEDVRRYNEQVIDALEKNGQMQQEQLECMRIWQEWAQSKDAKLYEKAVAMAEEMSSVPSGFEPSDCPS